MSVYLARAGATPPVRAILGGGSDTEVWIGAGILVAAIVGAVYAIRRKPPKY